MKKIGEILLQKQSFKEIMMGNWAIVRAMLEAKVEVVTSYPGSPTPEIASAIAEVKKNSNPFYFEFSTNEKTALEVAFGASVNGSLSCVFFKSVGLNVAADSFVQLALMELPGGMVILLGDDPGANSSQNEQDNLHLAKLSYIPVFEPQNPQEAYLMFKSACKISSGMKMPVIIRLTTHVCHAKEKISFGPLAELNEVKNKQGLFSVENGPYIPITSKVFPLKRKALEKLEMFRKNISESEEFVNFTDNNNKIYGIITMGLPHLSLMDTLQDAKIKPDILKLGIVYPMPKENIIKFLESHKHVKILEELDPILETEIKALAYENKINTEIIGKIDAEEWVGEYSPEKVEDILRNCWPQIFKEKAHYTETSYKITPRPAQLCPGCGHRSAFYAIKQAITDDDTITVADIGCHTLGFLPPYNIGEVLLCMGHSNGTAAGLGINNNKKILSFLGDSTLFHAGLPGIVNAVFNKHSHTLIIMENGTTAMTGHQDHPATGKNFNEITEKISIKDLLKGLGVKHIWEVDTYKQSELTKAVKEAMELEEFSVVIAKHPCMLKFVRTLKQKGKTTPPQVVINQNCDNSKVCISDFACPTYQFDENGEVWVQPDLCIGDGSCKQVCPHKAIESGKGEKK